MISSDDKRAARAEIASRMRALTREELAAKSLTACERAFPAFAGAKRVLAYAPMAREADCSRLIELLAGAGARIAFPRALPGGRLELYYADWPGGLAPGAYGIREPLGNERAALGELDALIVPLAAFDMTGARLGRGGGYYDRLLAENRALAVGFALECQRIERVPRDEWDAYLDMAATERAVYAFDSAENIRNGCELI